MTRQIRRNKVKNELKKQGKGNKYMKQAWMSHQMNVVGESNYLAIQTNKLNPMQELFKSYLLKKVKEGKEKLEKENKPSMFKNVKNAISKLKDKIVK